MCIIEIESTRFNSPPPDIGTKRKLEKREHVVPPEIGRGVEGKKNLFRSLRLFSNRKHGGGGGDSESISAGSESRQTTDRTSNPISHHTSCIWSARGEGRGREGTWRDNTGKRTLVETSISRTKQIPRQIGRFSLWPPTFLTRHVRSIR